MTILRETLAEERHEPIPPEPSGLDYQHFGNLRLTVRHGCTLDALRTAHTFLAMLIELEGAKPKETA